jgi:serine protease Do
MKRLPACVACLSFGIILGSYVATRLSHGQVAPPPGQPVAPVPAERTSYRGLVKRVLPAVVSLEIKSVRARPGRPAEPARDSDPSSLGFGSGFLIDPAGVVLTCSHVVEDADLVEVRLADGRRFVTRDIRSDARTDVALLRLDAKVALPALELGESAAAEIGDRVLAVGAPFGLAGSVTAGIVSGKGRSLRVNQYEDFVQTDAAINPGNSGGPLISLEGKVIGINSAIKSKSGGFQGVGLAISSDLVRSVVPSLLRDGVVRRGYLGMQVNDLDSPDLANRLGLEQGPGVVVTRVFERGPADRAGLKDGDLIVGLAGKAVRDSKEVQFAVAGLQSGKPTDITVLRDGKLLEANVTVEDQPREAITVPRPSDRLPGTGRDVLAIESAGLGVVDMTAARATALGVKDTPGAVVVGVDRAGLADRCGLRPGMVVGQVDGKAIASATALRELCTVEALTRGLLLQVRSATGGTTYLLLRE